MSKCVVCTHLNSVAENKRHDNPYTRSLVQALKARRKRTHSQPSKICNIHAPNFGTGQMTVVLSEALKNEDLSV